MRIKYLTAVFLTSISLSAISWGAQELKIEQGWSHVEFDVKNFGIHTVEGRFKTFEGTISLDDADITRSSVTVTIPIAGIDTGIKKRDAHLQTTEFFDSGSFPVMTFRSDRIEKKGDGLCSHRSADD